MSAADLPHGRGDRRARPERAAAGAAARRMLPGARASRAGGARGIARGCAVTIARAPHIAALFAAGTPIVGLCASGILIRAVAPLLADKRGEPPVVAVAEDGSSVVPLLGGHRGANALARAIADAHGRPRRDHHRRRSAPRLRARRAAARLAHRQSRAGQADRRRAARAASRWRSASKPALPIGCARRRAFRRRCAARASASPTARRTPTSMRWCFIRRCWRSASAASAAAPPTEIAALVEATLGRAGLAAGAVAAVVSVDAQDGRAGAPRARRTARRAGAVLRRARAARRDAAAADAVRGGVPRRPAARASPRARRSPPSARLAR